MNEDPAVMALLLAIAKLERARSLAPSARPEHHDLAVAAIDEALAQIGTARALLGGVGKPIGSVEAPTRPLAVVR